jgi:hypothetical protein
MVMVSLTCCCCCCEWAVDVVVVVVLLLLLLLLLLSPDYNGCCCAVGRVGCTLLRGARLCEGGTERNNLRQADGEGPATGVRVCVFVGEGHLERGAGLSECVCTGDACMKMGGVHRMQAVSPFVGWTK